MQFRQIQYFVCLYEEGSVTRAARRLSIVQPALSMQIAKLEEELGRQLFIRSAQGMQPTSEGRRLYRLFVPVLADFARARDEVMQGRGELVGQVKVGMIATIAQGVMANAIREFTQANPRVSLMLTDGFSGTLADGVFAGHLDAAVVNKPRRPLALNSEAIAEEDMLLVTGPHHPDLASEVSLQQVAQLRLVLPTRQHGLRQILESIAQAEDIALAPLVEIDSVSAILALLAQTDFATLLPRIAVRRQLREDTLRAHAVINPPLRRQLVCITHPRRPPGPAAAAFLAVLLRHVRGLGQDEFQ